MPDTNLCTPETAEEVRSLLDTGVIRPIHSLQRRRLWTDMTTRLTMNSIYEKQGGTISLSKLQVIESLARTGIESAPASALGHIQAVATHGGLSAALPHVGNVLSLGGLASAVAPWVAAASIAYDYREDINKNNLHDIVSDASSRNPQYRCSSPKGEDGKTQCDHAIEWLIERVEGQLAMKAASLFLAGVPALLQTLYRLPRKQIQHLRFQSSSSEKELYPTPSDASVWQPDADMCSGCNTELASKFAFYKVGSSSRHHCRVCGFNYCEKCCFYEVAVLNPLKAGGREKGVKEHCLVCTPCILSAKEQGQSLSNYQAGPLRQAETLKRNASPKSEADNGCRRAQAALYAIYHGRVDQVLVALTARDGGDHIIHMLGM
jgi:FYVE zinc finger